MVHCVIVGCNNYSQSRAKKLKSNTKDCSFFKIPKVRLHECGKTKELSGRRRCEWLSRINRRGIQEANADNYFVCSRHFVSGQPSHLFDECNPDWAPSVSLGYGFPSPNGSRYHRRKERSQRTGDEVPHHADEPDDVDEPDPMRASPAHSAEIEATPLTLEATCQTELCGSEIDHMQARISRLEGELKETKAAASSTRFTKEALQGRDDKVTFYTGLPSFVMLMSLFQLVKSHMSHTGRNSLTQFQEMVLFLMRLRLGCQFQDLAYRFDVSLSTASRIFEKWLDLFVDRTGPLVRWPDKEQIMKTMPVAFVDSFRLKVRVILDCFEVSIDRPSSYMPRAETWSHYKHRNTVKFLGGICPQDAVSFLSKAYGGRASDKHITKECGVLDLPEYGDVVLADRGFLIAESVGMCHATLAIPAFTKGKRQLSSEDVEKTREIANVRIHVERVIGMVRNKYNILKGSLPVEVLRVNAHGECQIDKIAHVCCALTNLCNSVVPFE